VKAVLEERAVRIAEGIREARAVERLLTNWQPGSTTAPHTPAAAQSAPRGEWAWQPRDGEAQGYPIHVADGPIFVGRTDAAALALLQRWRAERTPMGVAVAAARSSSSKRSGSLTARASRATSTSQASYRQPLTARSVVAGHEAWLRGFHGAGYRVYS
ncbi:unnamed protein product, partial [Polarella glacialis]